MKLAELSDGDLLRRARQQGIRYRSGPFVFCVRSSVGDFLRLLRAAYGSAELIEAGSISHYHLRVRRAVGYRRWLRPQVMLQVNGVEPFEPYPLDHAFAMFEWGLNWVIGTTAHRNLMLHSAVVEKAGRALVLPALPGSGKSTLCAGLLGCGWRLLSDEFGLVRHDDGMLLPLPRAAPLKNSSIDIVRGFSTELQLGPRFEKTRKGTVSHLFPPAESLRRQEEAAEPRWVIFPRYEPGQATRLIPQSRGMTFTRLVNNSFNYLVTAERGFHSLVRLVRETDSYELRNGDLGEAVAQVEQLLESDTQ